MADEKEKTLKVKLEYVTDKASATSVKAGLSDIQKSLDDTTKRAAKLKAELDDMNNRGPKVKATLASLTKNLDNDLARSAEKAELFSGRLEKVDRTATALEATGRAFGGTWGGILADLSGRVGDLSMALEQVQKLGGFGGLGKGLGALGGLSVGGVALAGAAGIGLGAAGYEGLRSAGIARGASLGQFATVGAYGAGKLFGDETASKWAKSIAELTGEIPKADEQIKNLTNSIKTTGQTTATVSNQMQLAIDQTIANRPGANWQPVSTAGVGGFSMSKNRRNVEIKAQMKQEEIEKNYEKERLKIINASKMELLNAERDYQRERKQAIKQFDLETKQMQQDHLIEMRRMQEDSDRRLKGLAVERDAVSYLQEWESSQTSQQRAEQDYQVLQSQRKANFELQLAQDKQDFEALQAQRRQSVSQQLDELKSSLSQESEIKKAGYAKTLDHTRDFVEKMQGIFEQLSYGGGGSINRQIEQILRAR